MKFRPDPVCKEAQKVSPCIFTGMMVERASSSAAGVNYGKHSAVPLVTCWCGVFHSSCNNHDFDTLLLLHPIYRLAFERCDRTGVFLKFQPFVFHIQSCLEISPTASSVNNLPFSHKIRLRVALLLAVALASIPIAST